MHRQNRRHFGLAAIAVICFGHGVCAPAARAGDRLGFSGAVSQIEGSAGGGLVPWALIGGLGTDEQLGAAGFATHVSTQDFSLFSAGASLSLDDRIETSVASQRFNADAAVPGTTLGQDIAGLKVRLLGDAIFAPDQWLPQISLGAQWKRTLDFDLTPRAVGAARGEDLEFYLAATKLYFAALDGRNVIVNATLRRTRANQFGLLGFGGDGSHFEFLPEVSAGVFLADQLLLGVEYRDKPNNLADLRESGAKDLFLAWAPFKSLTLTAAWVDLGPIAGKQAQRGAYISLWLGI